MDGLATSGAELNSMGFAQPELFEKPSVQDIADGFFDDDDDDLEEEDSTSPLKVKKQN